MKSKIEDKSGYSWMHSDLYKMHTHKGWGTFAKKNIPKDTLLMIFGGYVFNKSEEEKLPLRIQDIAIQIEKEFVIGIKKVSDLSDSDFVNHSCNPNAGIKGQISLYTMRDILKDEEITFDYGTVLFGTKKKPTYKLKCVCSVKDCRGEITDHDWIKVKFNKKFLPFYVREAIENKK